MRKKSRMIGGRTILLAFIRLRLQKKNLRLRTCTCNHL